MKYFSLFILFSLLFVSCFKDDHVPPTIIVDSPGNMASYAFDDIITVSGTASDDESLKSVKIELLNENQTSTDFSFEIPLNKREQDFTKSFQLDDRHLSSGKKYVKITAIDRGGNRESRFIEINYTELPKELLGILMVDQPVPGSYDLYFHDLVSNQYLQSFSGDFQDIVADAYHLMIWLSGGSSGNLINYDLDNQLVNWQQSPGLSFDPYFGKLHQMQDKNVAMAKGDGTVVTMDEDGIINRTFSLSPGAHAEEMIQLGVYLIVEERINGNSYLVTYVKSTGVMVQQVLFDKDIVKLSVRDNDEIYVATTNGTSSNLYLYNYIQNFETEPHSIPSGAITDLARINDNEVIVAHTTGLLRFTIDNNSMVSITNENTRQLCYDDLSGSLFALVGNTIKIYDHLGNTGGFIQPGNNIEKFVLYYNK